MPQDGRSVGIVVRIQIQAGVLMTNIDITG